MAEPKYIVDAWGEWPEGQTDAVYDILENLGTHPDTGEAMGTPSEIAKRLKIVLADPETAKWMADEDVEIHLVLKTPAQASSILPNERPARGKKKTSEGSFVDAVVKEKKGRPAGVEIVLNHDGTAWWVAVHVPPKLEGREPEADYSIYSKDAASRDEAEKIYKATNNMKQAQGRDWKREW